MRAVLILALAASACGAHSPGGMTGPSMSNRVQEAPRHPLESDQILERPRGAAQATVKHILIGWKSLSDYYQGDMDGRAEKRSMSEAEALVRALLQRLEGGAVFEALMIEHSEDPGSASTGKPYHVDAEAPFEKRFIDLSLRLSPGEWGVVRSRYGFHIIKRVK